MSVLDKALLKQIKTQAQQNDQIGFIKWMLENIIIKNYDAIDWVRVVCGVSENADLEQIYKKLRAE
ncbi:MAG: hypothetical protein ACK5X3_02725 [Pseudomonadota bacterium]|jgi:hypothetical protein